MYSKSDVITLSPVQNVNVYLNFVNFLQKEGAT